MGFKIINLERDIAGRGIPTELTPAPSLPIDNLEACGNWGAHRTP
jgi:hypothetical protein